MKRLFRNFGLALVLTMLMSGIAMAKTFVLHKDAPQFVYNNEAFEVIAYDNKENFYMVHPVGKPNYYFDIVYYDSEAYRHQYYVNGFDVTNKGCPLLKFASRAVKAIDYYKAVH